MTLCESSDAEPGASNDVSSFQIVITVSVHDADALWAAAMRSYVGTAEVEIGEVIETIGPPEDPAVEDCLRTLALPAGWEGCAICDIQVRSVPAPPATIIGPPPSAHPAVPDPFRSAQADRIDLSSLSANSLDTRWPASL